MTYKGTLFLDETGNTGPNLLDPAQPVFIEGGWWVSNEKRWDAKVRVGNLERKYGFSTSEVKGSQLIKHTHGKQFIRAVCSAVGQAGCIPFMYVAEKRYSACCRIVDTFFDPAYNPRIPNEETWDPELRQEQAQVFYDAGSHLIDAFARAYRAKDGQLMRQNVLDWRDEFLHRGRPDLAERIEGVLAEIEAEMLSEAQAGQGVLRAMDTLNFALVVGAIQHVELDVPGVCVIIHDETPVFEPAYEYIFNLLKQRKGNPAVIQMKDGRKFKAGFEKVEDLRFASSKVEPLVRAADYLVAGTRGFIHLARHGQPIDKTLSEIAFAGLGGILCEALTYKYPSLAPFPKLGTVLASTCFVKEVFGTLAEEIKEQS
ncbi:MAG: DUF3800 domain-containing protein [Candidatus Methylomirabilales bacterium]